MKRKTLTGLIAIVAIAATVMFAGCIEEERIPTQTQTILKPEITSVNFFYCTDVFESPPFLGIGRCNWLSPYEFFIFGLIENPGDLPVYDIKISYTLYDADGMIVGSDTTSLWPYFIDSILPKQDIPFRITTDTADIADYKLDIQYNIESDDLVPYRNFEQNNVNMKKTRNELIISGEIKNIGNEVSVCTEVMVVLYDKDGKIIDVLGADTNPVEINLGETSSFVIKESYSKNGLDKIDTYKLWVQGYDWKY